jgi:NAD(P)-dependent dehydrogenase (short-subunit alcohol dehydrogenase family)
MATPHDTSTGHSRIAVVTGASTGIGNATALRLARAGWTVYATVRRDDDAQRLRNDGAGMIRPVIMDIENADSIADAAAHIDEVCGTQGLAALVNNAGVAIAGPLEFLPIDELRRQLEINVTGHVAVTQALLPALRRATGRIVFIGSIAGRSALPFTGAYSASKFALEAIADSWRIELQPWGLRVSIIEPGVILTPIWDTATKAADANLARMPAEVEKWYGRPLDGLRRRLSRGMKGRQPEAVAAVVEQALTARRPKARYVVGTDARMRLMLLQLPTALRDRIIVAGVKRL